MNDQPKLTAEQFVEELPELPEGGRWHELDCGQVKMLQSPDVDHGTAVLNLSKALAGWAGRTPNVGYACFDLAVLVKREPDSVLSPAISYFVDGERFGESDKLMSTMVPALVVELASTNDRRQAMRERVIAWHEAGVDEVWVVDPQEKTVRVLPAGEPTQLLAERHVVENRPVLPEFGVPVKTLFAEPKWWSK